MSLVTCPCRKSFASAPVSASLPRSDASTRPQRSVSAAYSPAIVSSSIAMRPRVAPASAAPVPALRGGAVAGARAHLHLHRERSLARQLSQRDAAADLLAL